MNIITDDQNKDTMNKNWLYDLRNISKNPKYSYTILRTPYIHKMMEILLCIENNNILLVGHPGVGKTELVYSFIRYITSESVTELLPMHLKRCQIYQLDPLRLVSNTTFRGQLESRIVQTFNQIEKNEYTILFIDEIHALSQNAGEASAAESIMSMFKAYMQLNNIAIIGTTTYDYYRMYIEKDAAIIRRFNVIIVEEPDQETLMQMITRKALYIGQRHGINIDHKTIQQVIGLTTLHMPHLKNPAKSIKVLDLAASHAYYTHNVVKIQKQEEQLNKKLTEIIMKKEQMVNEGKFEEAGQLRIEEKKIHDEIEKIKKQIIKARKITKDDIIHAIKQITNNTVLAYQHNVADIVSRNLKERLVNQEDAIESISNEIKRYFLFRLYERRPLSFLFIGPTGVGKTESAHIIAESLFGDKKQVIKLDMSEYHDAISMTALLGSPPGYIGYENSSKLIKKLKENPFQVIIFDEIEKAYSGVQNILLQILDTGVLTDNRGIEVDMRSTIIILTSNLGTDYIYNKPVGFRNSTDINDMYSYILNKVQKFFKPEVLARIDRIVFFKQLDRETSKIIAKKYIDILLKKLNIEIEIPEHIIDEVVNRSNIEKYGARNIQRTTERILTEYLISTRKVS